jgi:RyR domain/TrkA-N domain
MSERFSASGFNRLILLLTVRAGRMADFVNRHRVTIQACAGAIALSFGFWGWMIEKPPADYWGVLDNVFRTAQLITLQFPDLHGSPSLVLQIARLAVPIVAVLASFQVLIASVTRPARLALLPRISDHIVVCGSGTGSIDMTEAALTALATRGRQVVVVIPKISDQQRQILESIGLTVVDGDPLQAATLKSLHLSRAAALFLLGEDDVANINIAVAALPAIDERPGELPPLVLAVKIEREELAAELDATLDKLSRSRGVRYHRLSPTRESVRLELLRFAPALLKTDKSAASHVVVVGLNGDWRPTVAQIIIGTQDNPTKRPLLTFAVDQCEAEALERWRKDKPELDLVADITVLMRDTDAALPASELCAPRLRNYPPPQLAVVLRQDADAIASMLALRRPGNCLGTEAVPILVHQSKDDRLLPSLAHMHISDRDLTNLVAIGGLVRAETIERILDRKGDEMAIALHAHYLAEAKNLGVGVTAAIQAWDELPENLRNANRSSVEHAPILFAAAGYQIVANPEIKSSFPSDAEIELMAQVEHRRWMADRIERGWHFAANRDDRLMLHPDLIPYEQLSDTGKQKDRNAVQTLAGIMKNQGFAFVPSNLSI